MEGGKSKNGTCVPGSIYFKLQSNRLGDDENKMTIDGSNGYVGIGTTSPITTLDVNGTVTTNYVNVNSDGRLYDNVLRIDDSLNKICDISGVQYTLNGDTKTLVGVIAQEIDEHIPLAVDKTNPDNWSVNYNVIIGHMIEAIKTLNTEIDAMKTEITALKDGSGMIPL